MSTRIENFTLHNDRGESVLASDILVWAKSHPAPLTFDTTCYTWVLNGRTYRARPGQKARWKVLPDASGFICFDDNLKKDNCFLRNAFGEVTHQLTVPWELTGRDVPADADMWFINICEHIDGEFGVSAYVENAGDFYFELDYHNAKFLWGKPIRI